MEIEKGTVRRISHLARIKIAEEEIKDIQLKLSRILSWVEQLDAVDTCDINPMTKVVDLELPWRQDKIFEGGNAEIVISNAPAKEKHLYIVPKVIE